MGKKICPDCGQVGVYQAYVEDGSFGEWCPNCRKGVKGIEGEVYQGTEQIEDFRKLFEMEFNKIISQIRAGNENACPQCGRADLYQSYIEDGGQGKWCPHCNKSVKRMLGEI